MSHIDLTKVQHKCAKQGCSHVDAPLHRHHKGSEKMFLWAFIRRKKSKHYKAFHRKYEQFREQDVVRICDWHHREIHELYARLVNAEKLLLRKRLRNFTWMQAEILMRKLRRACDQWLTMNTPGSPPWKAKEVRNLKETLHEA